MVIWAYDVFWLWQARVLYVSVEMNANNDISSNILSRGGIWRWTSTLPERQLFFLLIWVLKAGEGRKGCIQLELALYFIKTLYSFWACSRMTFYFDF